MHLLGNCFHFHPVLSVYSCGSDQSGSRQEERALCRPHRRVVVCSALIDLSAAAAENGSIAKSARLVQRPLCSDEGMHRDTKTGVEEGGRGAEMSEVAPAFTADHG